MKCQLKPLGGLTEEKELLVLGVFDGEVGLPFGLGKTSDCFEKIMQQDFQAKTGTHFIFYPGRLDLPRRILLWGLGNQSSFDLTGAREAASDLSLFLKGLSVKTAAIKVFGNTADPAMVRAMAEGLSLGLYAFKKYKSEKHGDCLESIALLAEANENTEKAFRVGKVLAENVSLARDLINEPPNIKTPRYFARKAMEVSQTSHGVISMTLLAKDDLTRLGLNLILAVADGSSNPPRLAILEYKPKDCKNPEGPYVFVGKGVCFDSGGLQIKSGDNMEGMKMDMAGAAAVLATVKSAAELELPFWVMGFMPVLENLLSGSAYKPGDVIKSCSGKTVEIAHTDAEGRLVLFDAIAYAQKRSALKPKLIVDLATLTSACIVALGHHFAGVIGNNQEYINQLIKAGEKSGDSLWQLPLDKRFAKELESKVADLKNVGSGWGGAIIAAAFLQKAVEESQPWVHIDCAGPAVPENGMASGFGVRLLTQFLLDL